MEPIFKEHVFPKYVDENVKKSQVQGFADPTLRSFVLLDSSALLKDQYKEEGFEDEFIASFLHAAKDLAASGRRATDRPGMYVMWNHSYAIPVLFLTRHCMELAMKRAIRKCGYKPKMSHDLSGLWSSLLSNLPEQRGREDRRAIKNMGSFVKAIADIDDNGISLRYPQDRSGSLTQDRPLFVNNERVVLYLEKFVEQLELINFDCLGQAD